MKLALIAGLAGVGLCLIDVGHAEEKDKEAAGEVKPKVKVQGVLRHHRQDVKSVEAWMGHEYTVNGKPILATVEVTTKVLRKFVGKTVVVEGVWNPGKKWEPSPEDAVLQTPSFGIDEVVMIGSGIEASKVELVEEKEE